MVSLLLIISFLLHAVTLYVLYQLFQQLESQKQHDNEELETLLLEFIQEIKHENERLHQLSSQQSKYHSMDGDHIDSAEVMQESSSAKTEQYLEDFDISDLLIPHEEVTELSELGKMLQLQEEGYATDEIARKLHRGKTEVELMLKLQHSNQNT